MDLIGEYICVKSISFSFRLFERGEKVNIYRSGDSGYYADGTFGSYLTEYIINDSFKLLSEIRKEKLNKLING